MEQEKHYDLQQYFHSGVLSEIERMEMKYGRNAVINAVQTYLESYCKEE